VRRARSLLNSVRNPHIQKARKLRKRAMRERAGAFLVEGTNGIAEALAVGRGPDLLFVNEPPPDSVLPLLEQARAARVAIHHVTPAVMAAMSGTETPPRILGIVPFVDREPQRLLEGPAQLFVVLDQLRDPGNLGTILRTAWAAGVDGVCVGAGSVDVYNPKVVRASAGAITAMALAVCHDAHGLQHQL